MSVAVLLVRRWHDGGLYAYGWAGRNGDLVLSGSGAAESRPDALLSAAEELAASAIGNAPTVLVSRDEDKPAVLRGAPIASVVVGTEHGLAVLAEQLAAQRLVQAATAARWDWRHRVEWTTPGRIAATLVPAIGGPYAVARLLMVSPVTVCRWYRAGVPLAQVDALCALVPGLEPREVRPDLYTGAKP